MPINDPEEWPKTSKIPPLPPRYNKTKKEKANKEEKKLLMKKNCKFSKKKIE